MSFWVRFGWTCAVDRRQVHAAKTPRPKTRRKTYDAACGARVRLLGFPIKDKPGDAMSAAWPPYVDQAAEWGYTRCADCMKAAPGKPVRVGLVSA